MENKTTPLNFLFMFLITPIIVFLMMVNAAYPAMKVYNMFVPDYFGLPVLTLPYAVMVFLTVSMFKGSRGYRTDDIRGDSTKHNDIIMMFLAPWFVYAIAFITYKFFIV